MKRLITAILIALCLLGCATIKHTVTSEQPIDKKTVVGIGDVVLRVNKQRDLENIFGKASISGRKTNEGYSELRFAGVEKSGEVVFYRKDVQIITNETTLSRSPFSFTRGSSNTTMTGNYYGVGNVGTVNANANTTSSSTTISPTSDYHVVVPADTIPIRLSPEETKIFMEGYVIEIINATQVSLEYKITRY